MRHSISILLITSFTAAAGVFWLTGAGEGQTGSALSIRCDARRPISRLPFTIDECGSYYLTACLHGNAGQSGITIAADDVSIDLNGFSLIGEPGSLHGIEVQQSANVSLVNGGLSSWGQHGVWVNGEGSVHVRGLRCRGNGGSGIEGGDGLLTVSESAFLDNQLSGLVAGHGSRIRDCVAVSNGGNGIECTSATVCSCTVNQHLAVDSVGIVANTSTVVECSLRDNWEGIEGQFGCRITDCAVAQSTVAAVRLNDKCFLSDSALSNSTLTGAGVLVGTGAAGSGTDNVIDGVKVSGFATGILVPELAERNLVVRNMATRNSTNYSIAGTDNGDAQVVAAEMGFDNTDPTANLQH